MDFLLKDQFASFRPTESTCTTAAISTILHHTTDLLKTNNFVTITLVDFAKIFDTNNRKILATKLSSHDLPDAIYNWLINLLED